jgi:hypothetical protein
MVQKTYYKTKDYCKVKFTVTNNDAETLAILGLNSDWENLISMKKKKDGSFFAEVTLPKNSKHEFRYLANEQLWLNEPSVESIPNAFGEANSLLSL